jgi:hypothetical protein
MLLLNKIKTDLNLTRNEFIYGLVTTTRRLERLAAQVEVTYKFCAAPKEAARVAVINPPSVRNMKKMWVVKDNLYSQTTTNYDYRESPCKLRKSCPYRVHSRSK